MLFNSYVFLCVFLPLVLLVFWLLGRSSRRELSIAWLVASSLVFYGWWNPVYLSLIVASVTANFMFGRALVTTSGRRRSALLTLGVCSNLGALGYFKYANFFVDSLNSAVGSNLHLETIVLPLAISFFTFQQIAYLVDASRGETEEHRFLHYALFVTFFPQFIAGPIVHHKEMLPQFTRRRRLTLSARDMSIGTTIFVLGLFKKVVIADGISEYVPPAFDAAAAGHALTMAAAWTGTLAYTFQLYFDFSGYSDMAIGLARMFGIRLPLNFDAPYRSTSIIDFWRRWHITLSRFLRDYVYIPLGGNRRGPLRRHVNVMATMLLGGLWHGAGWNFVLWGGLHGVLLVVNHLWRAAVPERLRTGRLADTLGWALTFVLVAVAWVPFRAETTASTLTIWRGMAGVSAQGGTVALGSHTPVVWLVGLLAGCLLLPTTQDFVGRYRPALGFRPRTAGTTLPLRWRPTPAWAALTLAFFLVAFAMLQRPSEFLYFQF